MTALTWFLMIFLPILLVIIGVLLLVRRLLSRLSKRRKGQDSWRVTRQTSAALLVVGTLMIVAGVILYLIGLYPTAFDPFANVGG
jgi:uncharacterized membrane protein